MEEKVDLNIDCYGLLEIDTVATSSEITRAYRQKALKVHPDKTANSSSELFHQLNQAFSILINEKTRVIYDKFLQNKRLSQERNFKMSQARKNFKEDLLEREKRAKLEKEQLEKEISDQLRKFKRPSNNFEDLSVRVKFVQEANLRKVPNVSSIEIIGTSALLTFESITDKEYFIDHEWDGIIYEGEKKKKEVNLETLKAYEQVVFTKLRSLKFNY